MRTIRWTLAIAAFALTANLPAHALAINSADAGIQLATARPHEVRAGALVRAKTGETLGVVVRVAHGKRGYCEDVFIRDAAGAIRRVPALVIYKRHGAFVANLTKAQFDAAPR